MSKDSLSGSYSITDLSREFAVTPRTLRFYEEKGLLNPKRSGKNRIYSVGDRTRLRLILRGRQLGLSLEESAEVIGLYAPGTPNHEQLHRLLQKIEEKRQQWLLDHTDQGRKQDHELTREFVLNMFYEQ